MKFLIRSRKNKAYRQHLFERFGSRLPKVKKGRVIHIHVVSVGESNAAAILIHRLMAEYPHLDMLITVTTPTGRGVLLNQFSHYQRVSICYLPIDLPLFVSRFLKHAQPKLSIMFETELWPNFLHYAKLFNVPVSLVNGRLSVKSLRGYLRIPRLSREMSQSLSLVLAQYKADKKRLVRMGCHYSKSCAIGNLKFDIAISQQQLEEGKKLQSQLQRPTWVAVSTHSGEEELLLETHKTLLSHIPNALLVLVPRHKERFGEVLDYTESAAQTQSRTSGEIIQPDTQVYIGDTLGEMFVYLSMSHLAFVGGSFVENGGHNPIEPAAVGVPVLSGPSDFNFKAVYKESVQKGFCIQINSVDELKNELIRLFEDEEQRTKMSEVAKTMVSQNRGVVDRVMTKLQPYLT